MRLNFKVLLFCRYLLLMKLNSWCLNDLDTPYKVWMIQVTCLTCCFRCCQYTRSMSGTITTVSRSWPNANRIPCKILKSLTFKLEFIINKTFQICRPSYSSWKEARLQGTLFGNVPHIPNAPGYLSEEEQNIHAAIISDVSDPAIYHHPAWAVGPHTPRSRGEEVPGEREGEARGPQ